ncbi:hypothetical protein [Pseudomonas chlororaphis]|uniref:hypothetical protein n=1 Tax=Pseudomonas chlororaphis TaxID=587753 RepID=UPI00236616BB|nr:hypothetical protein [Pseudomonas chlororaphis]WDG52447.1 hypothetical protein PUP76_21610 [Pseudomonas chlororaphis]WDH86536.1 hypothetical protein PUP74_20575 [Pseudomonas chlororaphis]
MPTENNPAVIYLGPACEAETSDGRTWAEDWPWPDCECGRQPVQYVLGETFNRVKAERDALQERLTKTDQWVDGLEGLLRLARQFVVNGIELGYIQMPDLDTPDPALELVPKIDAALSAGSGPQLEWRTIPAGPRAESPARCNCGSCPAGCTGAKP